MTGAPAKRRGSLRLASWNVNGLRACGRKGFAAWLAGSAADLVGVQELRARPEDLPPALRDPPGFRAFFQPSERPGYSGVALFTRLPVDRVESSLGEPRFDREGRLQLAHLGRLVIANVYFPKGSGTLRDNSRVPYKLAFYRRLFRRLERLRRGGRRVVVLGDFNTAHREIDLARPRENRRTSGFLPEERAEIDRWLAAGWVDAFRLFEPGAGHYTWWSQRLGARERNVGWRIDLVLVSPPVVPHLRAAWIAPGVRGSDHCPVGIDLDRAVLGRRAGGATGGRRGLTRRR